MCVCVLFVQEYTVTLRAVTWTRQKVKESPVLVAAQNCGVEAWEFMGLNRFGELSYLTATSCNEVQRTSK